jgi:1-acyl-sn-glycerol-3-phosphate acyltransferase
LLDLSDINKTIGEAVRIRMKPIDYFYDNPSSGEGHFPQRFCTFFMGLVRIIIKPLFRYKAYGLDKPESLPKGSGFIVVGNHSSYLDPVFVMMALRPRPIRYIAKEQFLNFSRIIRRLAAWAGVFPVKRNSADTSAIKRSVRMLKRGEIVGIFPEGTRVRSSDQEVKYHEGVAFIAQLAKTPVVPARIWNADKIWPKGAHFFRLPKITLCFGDPLSLDDERFAALPKDERFKAFTHAIMEQVYTMEFPK